jgi:hypothetical protein
MTKYTIEYKGKVLNTSHFSDISDEKCEEIRQAYYTKPEKHLVYDNLVKVRRGSINVSNITKYYFKDLMSEVKLNGPKWSIAEVLECNDLIRYYYSRTLSSETMYPSWAPEIDKFETALRLSGGGVTMKPSNFPMKTVDYILEKYNINDNYYDFSCGWGVRMLSAMKHNINYYGTDPNTILVNRLTSLHKDYNLVNNANTLIDIRSTGSEVFHPNWENKMGVAFSSPPYFSLENYMFGEQSIKKYPEYSDWLKFYMKPTIENCKRYLIDGGHLLINIKNFRKFSLYDDTFNLCIDLGLTFVEQFEMKNIKRPSAKVDLNTNEFIMVFKVVH